MREPNTEIDTNPMENVDTPVVPEADDVRVVSDEGLRKLLATCDGGGFADVRDAAIIRLIENSTDIDDSSTPNAGGGLDRSRHPQCLPRHGRDVRGTAGVDRGGRNLVHIDTNLTTFRNVATVPVGGACDATLASSSAVRRCLARTAPPARCSTSAGTSAAR